MTFLTQCSKQLIMPCRRIRVFDVGTDLKNMTDAWARALHKKRTFENDVEVRH